MTNKSKKPQVSRGEAIRDHLINPDDQSRMMKMGFRVMDDGKVINYIGENSKGPTGKEKERGAGREVRIYEDQLMGRRLLPCPFCGREVQMKWRRYFEEFISCECGLIVKMRNAKAGRFVLADYWNNRFLEPNEKKEGG
jgi:hypothetical protein